MLLNIIVDISLCHHAHCGDYSWILWRIWICFFFSLFGLILVKLDKIETVFFWALLTCCNVKNWHVFGSIRKWVSQVPLRFRRNQSDVVEEEEDALK